MGKDWAFKDKTGIRYGRLVVLERGANKGNKIWWICKCDCGKTTSVPAGNLGRCTFSCGCLQASVNKTHGISHFAERGAWKAMRRRCEVDKNYAGRGIKVCDRWLGRDGFKNFMDDMGRRPFDGAEIERINNDGDYCPENCRWATRKEQCQNMRSNHLVTYNGVTKPLTAWAETLGVKPATLAGRIYRGWSVERAFTQSIQLKRGINDGSLSTVGN